MLGANGGKADDFVRLAKVGLDVGAGDDKLPFDDCKAFDKENGNAEKLDEIIPLESLDYLHGSGSLGHHGGLTDTLARWFRCVKKGGYLIASVPDFDAYEKRCWPSKFNGDHKWAFSLWRKGALNCKNFIHVPTLLAPFNVKLSRLVLTNFDFQKPDDVDQTREESEGVKMLGGMGDSKMKALCMLQSKPP